MLKYHTDNKSSYFVLSSKVIDYSVGVLRHVRYISCTNDSLTSLTKQGYIAAHETNDRNIK